MKVITEADEEIALGTTETTPTISIVDYSRRETDDFGVTTVVERGFARRLSVRLALATADVDVVQLRLAELRASSARWIADDRFAWLDVEGFYKDFELDLATPSISYCTLTVEGLAEAEVVADVGGDPAPLGSSSTLLLLHPVTVTNAVLTSSNVAETDHSEWAAGTTYALGARVIKASTHRIYESVAATNLGHDPAAETGHWVDVGPTNRWAMFDQALGSVTAQPSSIVVTLAPGVIDALALLDVAGDSVRVQAAGYDVTKPVGLGSIQFLDVPASGAAITVTVTGTGQVAIGTLLAGPLVSLGVTEVSPTAGITDFSRKDVDDFGGVTVVERAWAKRMTARALISSDAVDVVANRIAAVRARPCLWIGDEDSDSLTVYGFFRDFSLEVGESVSHLSLTIEGLSKAEAPGGPTFGQDGQDGLSIAEVMAYQRKAGTAPATPTGGSYDFATKILTPPASWAVLPPAGTDPLYAAKATASIQGTTGTATPTWVGVGKIAVDGAAGVDGAGVDVIFTRSAAQPSTPAASSGAPAGWYSDVASVPASANPLWSSFGQRANSTSNYTWDTPARVEGATGAAGLNNAPLYIYKRATSTPALPTAIATYTFATGVLSGLDNGWSMTIPANDGNPLYRSQALASSSTATDTVSPSEWVAAAIVVQDGAAGAAGPAIVIQPDKAGFTYVNGTLSPAAQTITYTAALQSVSGTISWELRNVAGTVTKTGTGATFAVTQADIGSSAAAGIVTAICSGIKAHFALVLLADQTATRVTQGLDIGVANGAGTTINLTSTGGGVTTTGNSASNAAFAWGHYAYTAQAYAGGVVVSGRSATNGLHVLSLSPSLPATPFTDAPPGYSWYVQSHGAASAFYVAGSYVSGGPVVAAGDLLAIEYDGVAVRWWRTPAGATAPTLVKTETASVVAGITYRALVYVHSGSMTDLNLVPGNKANFSAIGGPGTPAPNSGTTLSLVALNPSLMTIVGNSVTGDPAWTWQGCYSLEAHIRSAATTFRFTSVAQYLMAGLVSLVPTGLDPVGMVAVYSQGGSVLVYVPGYGNIAVGTTTTADTWGVSTDNVKMYVTKSGSAGSSIVWSETLATMGFAVNQTWRVMCQILGSPGGVAAITFSAGTDNYLDNMGDGTTYARLPVANSVGSGAARRALIDLAQGHVGKHLDNIGDGSTYARPLASEMTAGAHKLGLPGSGKRLGDLRNIPPIGVMNLGYKWPSPPTFTADSAGNATITLPAATVPIGSASVSYNLRTVSVTGTPGTTVAYQLYFDDLGYAGGSPTLFATTTGSTVVSADGRVWPGGVAVAFPTSGTTGGTGSSGGGGGTGNPPSGGGGGTVGNP
jgi:hypothetical protein